MPAHPKLTPKQKRWILLCDEAGIFGCRYLARDYGVSATAIHLVAKKAGLRWPKMRGWRLWQKIGVEGVKLARQKRARTAQARQP